MVLAEWIVVSSLLAVTAITTAKLYRLHQRQPDLQHARRERDALLTEVLTLRQQVRDLGAAGGEAKGLADGYRVALDKIKTAELLTDARVEIERLRATLAAKEAEVASCLASAVAPRPTVWSDSTRR